MAQLSNGLSRRKSKLADFATELKSLFFMFIHFFFYHESRSCCVTERLGICVRLRKPSRAENSDLVSMQPSPSHVMILVRTCIEGIRPTTVETVYIMDTWCSNAHISTALLTNNPFNTDFLTSSLKIRVMRFRVSLTSGK
jgi:hypothetical protein